MGKPTDGMYTAFATMTDSPTQNFGVLVKANIYQRTVRRQEQVPLVSSEESLRKALAVSPELALGRWPFKEAFKLPYICKIHRKFNNKPRFS